MNQGEHLMKQGPLRVFLVLFFFLRVRVPKLWLKMQLQLGPQAWLLPHLLPMPEEKKRHCGETVFFSLIFAGTHLQTRSASFRSEKGRNSRILESSSGGSLELIFPTNQFVCSALASIMVAHKMSKI